MPHASYAPCELCSNHQPGRSGLNVNHYLHGRYQTKPFPSHSRDAISQLLTPMFFIQRNCPSHALRLPWPS